jgi:hypothetical protein
MAAIKFIAWCALTWLALKMLWLLAVIPVVGMLTEKRLGPRGIPPQGVGMAVHYGLPAVFGVWTGSLVAASLAALLARYLTVDFVSHHWLYRTVLFFFAPGISEYKQRGRLITGEVGDLFLIVSGGGSVWGWVLTLAVIELYSWAS